MLYLLCQTIKQTFEKKEFFAIKILPKCQLVRYSLSFNKLLFVCLIMNAAEIVYKLKCAGKSQTQIALDLSLSTGQVNNVIHGRVKSYRVAAYISSLIGCETSDISEHYAKTTQHETVEDR